MKLKYNIARVISYIRKINNIITSNILQMVTSPYYEYYMNGKKKREIHYYDNGQIFYIAYFDPYNQIHREDGPARIYYYDNGRIEREEYFIRGMVHREDGPATIVYEDTGVIVEMTYYRFNLKDRDDGPALIYRYSNGELNNIQYYKEDLLHREDGPAVIEYHDNIINSEEYWFNYKEYHEDYQINNWSDFCKNIDSLKIYQ